MTVEVINRLLQVYALDGELEKDPYYATAFGFALNTDTIYLFGQLAQKPLNRGEYQEIYKQLKDKGFTKFIYYSKERRKRLGGVALNEHLPGFWLVELE